MMLRGASVAAAALMLTTSAAALPAPAHGAIAQSAGYTRQVLVGPNPLMKSTGMVIQCAGDRRLLYSADTLRNTIFQVDLGTAEVTRITDDMEPPGQVLISPHTLELDGANRLYVTEYGPQTVRRLNTDGSGRVVIAGRVGEMDSSGATTGTTGIAFNSQGRLFAGDSIHDREFNSREDAGGLWEIDPAGLIPARKVARDLGMVEDIGFAPDEPAIAYVADVYGGRIHVVNVDTKQVNQLPTAFDRPWGVEYDNTRGRLLVLEMAGDLWSVDRRTGERRRLARIDRPGMTSIAIDRCGGGGGDVYVSNGLYGGLYRLDEPGQRLLPVLAEGSFAIPTSLNKVPGSGDTLWAGDFTSISTVARNGKVTRVRHFQVDDYRQPNPDDPQWLTLSALQTDHNTVYFGETGFFNDGITRLNLRTGRTHTITDPDEIFTPYHLRDGPGGVLLATGTDETLTAGRVLRVDPGAPRGERVSILVDNLQTVGGLRYDHATHRAYFSEVATGTIWAVNLDTCTPPACPRTLVASGLNTPEGLDLDPDGSLVVVEGDGDRRLLRLRLNPETGVAAGEPEEIARDLPTRLRGGIPKPLALDSLADVLVRDDGEIVVTAPEDASILTFRRAECSPAERRAFLQQEQQRILNLLGDLRTLKDADDLARLALPNPETRTAYNFYDHMFASARGMGFAVVNTGELGLGKPDVLLYAPSKDAADVTDPEGPDFTYELAGWAYGSVYTPRQRPSVLGKCIDRSEWFVHERSVHPADDWSNFAVPPEDEDWHGEKPANEPPLPTDCDPLCPAGISHGRIWDIHLWLGDDGAATVSLLSPDPIPGYDPGVGVGFFYPDR